MAAKDIQLPGVAPVDKDGISQEFLRQLVVTLEQMKAQMMAQESQNQVRKLQ